MEDLSLNTDVVSCSQTGTLVSIDEFPYCCDKIVKLYSQILFFTDDNEKHISG